ncbi:MAG: CHC2 zinc finger domain-containing protein [Candidatus Moranbacteria bacterium]|nr:CHC2 zinc finger domain-containing protein [Candidatus Moranbacteria bacterium]
MMKKFYYRPEKLTNRSLLEIFPEAAEIIPIKIQEHKIAIQEKEREISSFLKGIYALQADSFSEWFAEEFAKQFILSDLAALDRNLMRLKRFLPIIHPDKYTGEDLSEKIEIARNYPIQEIAQSKLELIPSGKNFRALCPFHNEDSPSLYLYTESNRFYCFGCNQKGDVISLTQALYGIGFVDAVKMLQN